MELKEFMQHFAEQFDDLDAATLSVETRYRELEDWSSIVALSIIAMIDEEYDTTITGTEMKSTTTIGELFQLVQSKL